MSPQVSIGFLVFNDRPFVGRALDSLLAQTHRDLEILICDDCSTDGSEEICRAYAARDPRIRYWRHPVNLGISRNMEFALAQASGEFFCWAADDDLWAPHFIETLLAALVERPERIVAFCPYRFIDEDDHPIEDMPVHAVDYSAAAPAARLDRLSRAWDDGFGYGLFRRASIVDVRFPVWWGVNAVCAYNNIYPTLYHYLARGDFHLVAGEPLWFNRLKRRPNHVLPYDGIGLRGELATILRRVNLHVKCVEAVYRGSGSLALAARAWPLLARRFAADLSGELRAVAAQMVRRGIRRTS
jgi:glycosyltransferase involved in cell wall biosynthesis